MRYILIIVGILLLLFGAAGAYEWAYFHPPFHPSVPLAGAIILPIGLATVDIVEAIRRNQG